MSEETIHISTIAFLRARGALDNVLKYVPGLRFEFLMIVRAVKRSADTLEVETITRLLLVEARVIDRPFCLGWRAYISVDTLVILV
jgi:hypothetical protein